MAWCRPGDKPLSEPMMACLLTHICVARLQWVKQHFWTLVPRCRMLSDGKIEARWHVQCFPLRAWYIVALKAWFCYFYATALLLAILCYTWVCYEETLSYHYSSDAFSHANCDIHSWNWWVLIPHNRTCGVISKLRFVRIRDTYTVILLKENGVVRGGWHFDFHHEDFDTRCFWNHAIFPRVLILPSDYVEASGAGK